MPVLHGAHLLLDAASTHRLGAWLSAASSALGGPFIEVRVGAPGTRACPPVLKVLLEEPNIWLGRTATGLIVCDRNQSWLTIDSAGAIDGVLAVVHDRAPPQVLLAALLIALRINGVHSLHAAALCVDGRALVLVGDSGAGKSTTATALASAGCAYLGDDGVLLREQSGDVELLAYGPTFRLTDHVLRSFSSLKPFLSKLTTDTKWQLDASAAFPGRYLTRWLGPTTLLFLGRSAHRKSTLSSLTLAEATGLLIAQSNGLSLDCHPDPRRHLALLALLARRAHVARLELGTEWLEDPPLAARGLIEWAGSPLQHFAPEAS